MAWSGYETLIYLCIRHELVWKSKHRRQSVAARAAVMRRSSQRRGPVFHVEWLFGNGINYILSGESRLPLLCIADKRLRLLRRRESLKEEEEEEEGENKAINKYRLANALKRASSRMEKKVPVGTSPFFQSQGFGSGNQPTKRNLDSLVIFQENGVFQSPQFFFILCFNQ